MVVEEVSRQNRKYFELNEMKIHNVWDGTNTLMEGRL